MTIAEDVARCIAAPAGDAVISECGTYRYFLTRRWRPGNKGVLWNMLNPSDADAVIPDPTVTKSVGFSTLWDFDYLAITNLRPFRSKNPAEMRQWRRAVPSKAMDVSQLQDKYVLEALRHVTRVVLAWGANGVHDPARAGFHRQFLTRRADAHVEVGHLGCTKDGHPRHPLMLAYKTPFTLFPKAA